MLRQANPTLDIDQELDAAALWCEVNPTKRKSPRGMGSFLTRWMSNAKDRPRSNLNPHPTSSTAWIEWNVDRLTEQGLASLTSQP
jgi:hypothetical protein